jgi:GNAT superfamily N-acetyltransferase
MRLLLDTNILIPLEPGADAIPSLAPVAAEFHALMTRGHHEALLHPAYRFDLERDRDEGRRSRTTMLAAKYPPLERPPSVNEALEAAVGSPDPGTNDWVDDQLLAAVQADAVDYLVTEDQGLHRKAERVGLQERVASLAEAVSILRNLFDIAVAPPPAVDMRKAHELDLTDPIFTSIRGDYPGFDVWMTGIRRAGRDCWTVTTPGSGYAAIAIIKPENEFEGVRERVLKISTFKVSDDYRGRHYGELLLKTIFGHVHANSYDLIYLTAFPRHEELLRLLADFGFEQRTAMPDGQVVVMKRLRPRDDEGLSALDYHIRYGPPAILSVTAPAVVVPIQPGFHSILFPEQEVELTGQTALFTAADEPFGNALRKAYLSHGVLRRLEPGSILLFYRSGDIQAVTTVGILEAWQASSVPEVIAHFVGKRSVYSFGQIAEMCKENEVLALRYRQDRVLRPPLSLADLLEHRVLRGPPQSIMRANREGLPWLAEQIDR